MTPLPLRPLDTGQSGQDLFATLPAVRPFWVPAGPYTELLYRRFSTRAQGYFQIKHWSVAEGTPDFSVAVSFRFGDRALVGLRESSLASPFLTGIGSSLWKGERAKIASVAFSPFQEFERGTARQAFYSPDGFRI